MLLWLALLTPLAAADGAAVQALLAPQSGTLADCFRVAGVTQTRATVEFHIAEGGHATQVRVRGEGASEPIRRCLASVITRQTFPNEVVGSDVEYPITLREGASAPTEAAPKEAAELVSLRVVDVQAGVGDRWLIADAKGQLMSDRMALTLVGTQGDLEALEAKVERHVLWAVLLGVATAGAGVVGLVGAQGYAEAPTSPSRRDMAMMAGGGVAFSALGLTTLYHLVRALDADSRQPFWHYVQRAQLEERITSAQQRAAD